jgi:hypothetical protein
MDEKGLSKQVSGACDQFFPAPRIEHLVSASATRRKFDSGPSASPAAPKQESPPVALWVKGKEGQQVLSPFTGAVVDVSGFPPGSEARCPYSGKIFLVPTKP